MQAISSRSWSLCSAFRRPPRAKGGVPPDSEHAPEVLAGSPRHGEWVDIGLPGTEVKIKTFVAYPERKDKAPVVIVIHEIFGMTDWVRGVADTFAAEGFIAVAPDLLSEPVLL
jgi:carboxymethylenebutenolidase